MLDPDVSVLSTRGITFAIRMKSHRVDRTKMSLDPGELLLEDHVEEPRIELADSTGGRGDVHRLLTTSQDHVFADR